MRSLKRVTRHVIFTSSLTVLLQASPAGAVDLVARVVDAADAKVFPGAVVQVRGGSASQRQAADSQGFVRLPGLSGSAYVLDVTLPDGREFVARTVLSPNRKTQFLDIDYARMAPPGDDDDY